VSAPTDLGLDHLADRAGTLRVFRQVFAVLAREHGAMITDLDHLDTDEAILAAFAQAGMDGLALEQVTVACRPADPRLVARRFEVLRSYGAITKVVDRPHERYHRAAFAPYVMLLFLRRMAAQGGQGELHQLLTLEGMGVRSAGAGTDDGRASVRRLVTVFRLMANQLAGLASASPVEELRENAELLWGNRTLIDAARQVHATVLQRWPDLDRECMQLRTALAAYGDAWTACCSTRRHRGSRRRAWPPRSPRAGRRCRCAPHRRARRPIPTARTPTGRPTTSPTCGTWSPACSRARPARTASGWPTSSTPGTGGPRPAGSWPG